MTTIEEKITIVQTETVSVSDKYKEKSYIKKGSDEYLDYLIYFQGRLNDITQNLTILNEDIIIDINNSEEKSLNIYDNLKSLHTSCIKLISSFKKSSFRSGVNTALRAFSNEVDNLHEIIYDINLIYIEIPKDKELNDTFHRISKLG